MFIGLHVALAGLTGVEELAITPEEGDAFMAAAGKVARHYSVTTTQKTMDWLAFCGCAAAIYAPRVVAISRAKRGRKPAEAAGVQDMSQVQPGSWRGPALVPSDG